MLNTIRGDITKITDALINICKRGDIVVSQDYGVAAMALGKGSQGPVDPGFEPTAAERRQKHLKGPSKRTDEDDKRFEESFLRLINTVNGAEI